MDTRFAIADCRVSRRVAQYTLYRRGGGDDARGEGGHSGATWLTLAEKVTLAQGAGGPLLAQLFLLLCSAVQVGVSLGRDGGDVTEESQVNVLCWLLPPRPAQCRSKVVEVAARTAPAVACCGFQSCWPTALR